MTAWHASSRAIIWTMIALLLIPASALADPKPKEWNPTINPANFVTTVDNQYFPLTPGRVMRYASASKGNAGETLVIEVRTDKKPIMGVMTTIVIETSTVDGQTVEISENWFAQDTDGNVWYFGEATQDFQNGQPGGTAGSWQAGVGGAVPGIIMPAHPETGTTFFQEHAPGVAEDMATIISTNETVTVPYNTFTNVVKTKDWNPLESGRVEHKYFAPGVGLVMEKAGNESLELVSIN